MSHEIYLTVIKFNVIQFSIEKIDSGMGHGLVLLDSVPTVQSWDISVLRQFSPGEFSPNKFNPI